MLYFIVALPGRFDEWCQAVTAGLIERVRGPAKVIGADTLPALSAALLAVGPAHAVVGLRQPGGRVRAALLQTNRRLIAAIDDPMVACGEIVAGGRADLAGAVRMVAASCAAVRGLAAAPGALVVRRHQARSDPVETAAAIAQHFGLPVSDDDVTAVIRDVEAAEATPEPRSLDQWWSERTDADREMIEGALGPYLDGADVSRSLPIAWARDLFFAGEERERPATGAIDITGRARRVIDGPYITLPPGSWSLTVTLFCTRDAAEREFLVEVVADVPLAAGALRPEREGSASIDLDFAIDELTENPVAIRVSTTRAAFDGAITLGGARLVPAASTGAAPDRSPEVML